MLFKKVSECITDEMDILFLFHFPLLHHRCVYVSRHGFHNGVMTYIYSMYSLTQQERNQ